MKRSSEREKLVEGYRGGDEKEIVQVVRSVESAVRSGWDGEVARPKP
jgi:hypothetical protein